MNRIARVVVRVSLLGTVFGLMAACLQAQSAQQPLGASRLLALVAGNALPENVADQINANGLAFRPDDAYRALLKTAGAGAIALAALDHAKTTIQDSATAGSGEEVLQHIANAGALIRDKKYDEAAAEITAALSGSFDRAACGFVMGEVLRREDNFEGAEEVYNQILVEDSAFPEVHTKLSYLFYRLQDPQSALREAKAALAQTPQNAEAHKNAGLALEAMHKYQASENEYDAALRIKPIYEPVEYDLGVLFMHDGAWDKAIAQYKKAIALDPTDAHAVYNLGFVFDQKNDIESAVREYRHAEQLDPKMYEPRQNLGHDLLTLNLNAEAVQEFKEMEEMFPNSAVCHDCLAGALFRTWDFGGAEKEYLTAEQLDPSDALPHLGIGSIREQQKKYDDALKEYRQAEQMDPTLSDPWIGAGRVLIIQHDYVHAAEELKQGEAMRSDRPEIHDQLAQAFAGMGKYDAAVDEFKAALALDPKQVQIMIRLAATYEKKGDWASSLNEYHQASLVDSGIDFRGKIIRLDEPDPQKEYESAQKRWNDHIAALKASGKSAEASSLEAQLQQTQAAPGQSQQLDALMQAGYKADMSRNFSAALDNFRKAVEIAEKIQPRDQRLVTALDLMGQNLIGQDNDAAQATFEREVKVATEIFGPESSATAAALQSLGRVAAFKGDDDGAEKYLFKAVDINTKVFGENSDQVAQGLMIASSLYLSRKEFAKAEPYMQRAVHIEESVYGADNIQMAGPLGGLCALYDQWGKLDRSDACNKKLLTVLQKQYGENSPVIVQVLETDAKALRGMGRTTDADAVDRRVATIRAATMNPN